LDLKRIVPLSRFRPERNPNFYQVLKQESQIMMCHNDQFVFGTRGCYTILSALLVVVGIATSVGADELNWPQFRGSSGSGVNDSAPLISEFGPEKNLLWKTEVPTGHSSPCIWGNYIFLTGYSQENSKLETLAIDRRNGRIIWRQTAPANAIEKVHQTSSPASSTPTTDGERVYVYFGSCGLLCYDFEGNMQWKKPIPTPKSAYGTATSPVIVDDLLLLAIHKKKLLALDRKTGEKVWEHNDALFSCSYSVPLVHRTDARTEVILHGNRGIVALDASNGKSLWWVAGLPIDPVPTPILGDGLLYAIAYYPGGAEDDGITWPTFDALLKNLDKNQDDAISRDELPPKGYVILSRGGENGTGDVTLAMLISIVDRNKDNRLERKEWGGVSKYMNGLWKKENAILAIRPGAEGDVTTTNIVWKERKSLPEIPSALYYRGDLYAVKNGGVVTCLDGKTGDEHYRGRLGTRGLIYASPVAGDGKIFVSTLSGQVVVFEAGPVLKVLAKNNLGEPIAATPAIVDGTIYIRAEKHLFAFGK
jgi:outer membrane protein assembly factor BamB